MAVSNKGTATNNGKSRATFINSFFSFLITFILMFLSWIVLSGKFDPLLLWLGGISSFFVAYYFYDLLFPSMEENYIKIFFKFIIYTPWLILEIIKANFHLLRIVFHPRMNELIDPHIITFKTNLKSDIAIATLANSITLTPGTITVTADSDGVFKVHAIDRESAQALPGTMLKKVAHVFGEDI
ncbi:MAG: Na+/H+ antiporter subunit E [Desulfobacteraceae bacterium]|nr:Na+/H+ antiporter subunit E [Desulfobacteraceae bacterium]